MDIMKNTVCALLVIAFFFSNNFPQVKRNDSVLYSHAIDEEKIQGKKRKVYRRRMIGALAKLSLDALGKAIWKSLFLGYMVLCSPLGHYAGAVTIAVFSVSMMRSLLLVCKYYLCSECMDNLVYAYDQTMQWLDETIIMTSVFFIGQEFLWWGIGWTEELTRTAVIVVNQKICEYVWVMQSPNHSFVSIFLLGSIRLQSTQWVETLKCEGFKVEENKYYYRITIGELHWEFFKESEFDRKVYSVLLSMARNEKGESVITSRPLAGALGWSHHDLLNRLVRDFKRKGNTFIGLIDTVSNVYQGRLQKAVLAILRQNFSLTLVEIRDRLLEQGWAYKVTVEQIRQALKKADFNEIHEDIRRYCAGASEEQGRSVFARGENTERLKIERTNQAYRVVLGDLYWDIEDENYFDLTALLHTLLTVRTHEDKPITGIRALGRMLDIGCYQNLQNLLKKYRYMAEEYRPLTVVYDKIEREKNDKKLRKIILDMWTEDITLSAQDIERRLEKREDVPSIGRDKIRSLMKEVDFWALRMKLAKEYSKGKYRKSTKWVLKKYQETIEHLLSQLAQGKKWSAAEIDEYIDNMPSSIRPVQNTERPEFTEPISKAWLKCFLFGLSKIRGNKVCCPKCGSFNTGRKSKAPEMQTVIDHNTGQTRQVSTFRFYCNNPHCPADSFTAPADGSHIIEESRFAKACLMLRLVMLMRSPYRGVANLMGTCKSVVFTELTYISEMANHWQEIFGPVCFSGTVCIDEKYVKIAAFKRTKKRPFGYLFFAVDPATGDLLHIEIFASRNKQSAEVFLMQLKAKGIYPKTIMTDLAETYDQPVRNVYGRSVTMARCFFHFKKNIFDHMNEQFGKKNVPEIAEQLKDAIFDVVDAKARKTIKKRYQALQKKKEKYLEKEPKLLPMFNCLQSYYPHLMRVVENQRVSIRTNNPAELVIRHFNQRYKVMSGFKSLKTARRHARLFQIVYRFTPLSDDVENKSKRGLTPLELAGYEVKHMPIYQYLTAPLLFNIDPVKNLTLLRDNAA